MEKLKARIAELEAENKRLKEREVCAVRQNQELMEMNEVLREQNEAMNKSTIELRKQALSGQKAVEVILNTGHNADCLFCGLKDKIAKEYQETVCRK